MPPSAPTLSHQAVVMLRPITRRDRVRATTGLRRWSQPCQQNCQRLEHSGRVRLEQERISFRLVEHTIAGLSDRCPPGRPLRNNSEAC